MEDAEGLNPEQALDEDAREGNDRLAPHLGERPPENVTFLCLVVD